MNNSLEVEHLLKVAAIGDAADAAFLRALKDEHGWSEVAPGGRKFEVPFARWVDTVCRFLEDGYAGVARMAVEDACAAEFCIGVLDELKTPESVSTLLAVGGPVIERPDTDTPMAVRVADGLNRVLSFKGAPRVGTDVEQRVREFLHRLLMIELSEAQRAVVVCALRGVGNEMSMDLIAELPPFTGSWAGLEGSSLRQIRQRLRRR